MRASAGIVFFTLVAAAHQASAGQTAAAPALALEQETPAVRAPLTNPARRTMTAIRMSAGERIALDGVLDEPIWMQATPASDFVQSDPDNGAPATERTEVRIVYDKDALYLGVTCFDSEPDKWLGYQRRRDEFLSADDRFQWVIDTYLDARSSYFFETNPSGLMGDALRGIGTNNRQWDGIWNEHVRHTDFGWVVEIQIPFRTLNFNPASDTWGINFQRTVRRKNEEILWSGWARNQGLSRMTSAGLLTGLHDISQGHGLDIKPYGLATWQASPGRGDSKGKGDKNAGVDVFYNPTPRLRTNLTINTDFAQTEVDQRLVNLTRFPLFFQEKRDFFLDGSTFFDFQSVGTGNNPTLVPFFSRRIGLGSNGQPQKIDVGARMGGQIGGEDVGALYVRTGSDAEITGEDFLVLRMKHRLLRQSYIGAMYTGRNARDGAVGAPTLHTAGADFSFATSTFRGRDNLELGGFFLDTNNPAKAGAHAAFGFKLDYPNDRWNQQFLYREIQSNFNAGVGFVPRTGFRRFHEQLEFGPRPRNSRIVRRYLFKFDYAQQNSTIDNAALNRDLDLKVFAAELQSQDTMEVHVLRNYEQLDRNFAINPAITLPIGSDYSFTRYRITGATANRRVIAVTPTIEWGEFYSGTRTRTALDLTVRVRPGVIIYTSGEWNRVNLAEGSFQTRLYRVVPELQFSPWISWVNNIQYDTQSAVLGWQSRFRWILKPGNDLYIVYTQNWLDDPLRNRFSTLDQNAASKFLYTYRF